MSLRSASVAGSLLLVLQATPTEAQLGALPEISAGEEVVGALTPDGASFLEFGPFAVFRFHGEAGTRYVADARSSEFDAYLILARPVGGITEFLREDDDGGEGTDARLRFPIDHSGEYLLIVRSWGDRTLGAFSLTLEEWEVPPPAPPRPLTVGQAVSGRLTEQSSLFLDEWDAAIRYDLWTFEGQGGESYRISMESDEFDSYLDFGPMSGGEVLVEASDDDGGEGTDALLRVVLPHDGVFGVRARPFGEHGGLGAYTLRMDPYTPSPPLRRPVEVDTVMTGELGVDDAVLEREIYYQEWVYRGMAGERLRIRMRSDDFDTYLSLGRELTDGAFEELAFNDDAPDDGLNPLIEFSLPSDGEYVIRARSFFGAEVGAYTLEVVRER